ncbi:MAG: CDP-diacylglycerol--glycerol-3-phosphate 3-phosphatidyltransferase [Bacilli bacterium]|nr:CDP-diacylglycerol--glycerol-3-phosphate 3-phosphatidyltransferase [Bacilli bacterium]
MNLPNKLTVLRLVLTILIIIILLFPFDTMGMGLPKLFINEVLVIDTKYIISGILFVLASFTDTLDGYLARKLNLVTDLGKMMDSIADKVLVDSVLIILASYGFIHPIIPVVIVLRDIVVDAIKMAAGNKGVVVAAIMSGKIKSFLLMFGISLTLFYNLPFELWNLRVSDFILIVAAILALTSSVEYFNKYKKYMV